jgi:hypothetical protein
MFRVYSDSRQDINNELFQAGFDPIDNPGFYITTMSTATTSTWTFGTDGDLTVPGNIKSQTIPQVGTIITGIEAYLSAGAPYGYTWNNATSPNFVSFYGRGSSIIGWTFNSTSSSVTITGLDPLGTWSLAFSGDPGAGPYTAHSPDYAPAYSNNLQIETGSASWNFNTGGQLSNNDDGYLSLRGSSIGPTSRIHLRNTDNDPTSDVNIHLQTGTGGDIFEIFQLGGGASVPYTSGLRTNSATAPILIQTNNGATSTSTWTFGTDGNLTLPDASILPTACGQKSISLDGDNLTIDLSTQTTTYNVMVVSPAIGYEGSDTHTILLGQAIVGQRLVIVNISTYCALQIGAYVVPNAGPLQGTAEFIYATLDGTSGWIPLYGVTS